MNAIHGLLTLANTAPAATASADGADSLLRTLTGLPEQASDQAEASDPLFVFIIGLSVFFFVLIIVLMVWFALKYRRREPGQEAISQASHSNLLEIAWSLPPLVIVMIIFFVGMKGFVTMANPSANTIRVDVLAKKWNWSFSYPGTALQNHPELLLPKGVPVEVVVRSEDKDVIHSLFIPAFRVKKDAVPNKYNELYFTPTRSGTYPVFCAEYCGTSHSTMLSRVTVYDTKAQWAKAVEDAARLPFKELPDELFAEWLAIGNAEQFEQFREKVAAIDTEWEEKAGKMIQPSVRGEMLATSHGCMQCHTADGERSTGPTWKNLYRLERTFTDGTKAVADENYLRESILQPNRKVVATYASGQMPQFQGKIPEREIAAILSYIRSLKD